MFLTWPRRLQGVGRGCNSQKGERPRLPSIARDAVRASRDLLERRGRKEVTKEVQLLSPKLSKRAEGPVPGGRSELLQEEASNRRCP